MKRFIAGLLMLVMLFSMTGVSNVFAAESGNDASANESSTEMPESVQWVYAKVKGTDGVITSDMIQDGVYLLVNAVLGKAVKAAERCPYDGYSVSGDTAAYENGSRAAWEWTIQKEEGTDTFKILTTATADTEAVQYLTICDADLQSDDNTSTAVTIETETSKGQTYTISQTSVGYGAPTTWYNDAVFIGSTAKNSESRGYLNRRGDTYVGTWNNADEGSCFYLYKKCYSLTDAALAEATAGVGPESIYREGWTDYAEALAEAKHGFESPEQAVGALNELCKSVEMLVPYDTETVYIKHTGTALPEDGIYLIVTQRMENYAMSNERVTSEVDETWAGNLVITPMNIVNGELEQAADAKYEWQFTKTDEGYKIQDQAGSYLGISNINAKNGVSLTAEEVTMKVTSSNSNGADTFVIGNSTDTGYINCHKQSGDIYAHAGVGTWTTGASDGGSRMFLYKKAIKVNRTEIQEITDKVRGTEDDYTVDTWNAYDRALSAAGADFETHVEAQEALDDLRLAAASLVTIDTSVLKTVYVKLTPDFTSDQAITDGTYLIMGARTNAAGNYNNSQSANYLVKHDFSYYAVSDNHGETPADQLEGQFGDYEWRLVGTSTNNNKVTCYIQPENDLTKYIYINASNSTDQGILLGTETQKEIMTIKVGNSAYSNSLSIGNEADDGWFNHRADRNPLGVGTYTDDGTQDPGSAFYLYRKEYAVDTAPFEAMVNPTASYDETDYNEYTEALNTAKAVLGTGGEAYEAWFRLAQAAARLTEGMISASDLEHDTEWTDNSIIDCSSASLEYDGTSALVKTESALTFDLSAATGFELLTACGRETGMVMAVVKDAAGAALRAYLIDTYYDVETPQMYIPIVRDMDIPAGASVDVYGCLVKSIVDERISSVMSVRGRAIEVTTEDIVAAVLQELGLEEKLAIDDVAVSYMDESSVLKGMTASNVSTYALNTAAEDAEETTNTTIYTVNVHGCRIYRNTQSVNYVSLSELMQNGKTAFIKEGNSSKFVLADYQKTGPQNEIYLESGESIVIGLEDEPVVNYTVYLRNNNSVSYQPLVFEKVEDGYAATITNENSGTSVISLGMIKMSVEGGAVPAPAAFIMTNSMAEAVLAAMNVDWNEGTDLFEDVKEQDYFFDAVLWAIENEVTTGVSETLFAPGKECTRAEAVTFLWRAAGKPEVTDKKIAFVDVVEGSYYEAAVRWALEEGITTGVDAEHFAPDDVCTRAQVVTFLWRAAGEQKAANGENTFTDIVEGSYYEAAVRWALEEGITTGVDAEHFAPDDVCLRGQAVTFLYRAMSE